MTLNFPTSIYTNDDAETELGNNTVLTPNDGATITINGYGYTFDDDRMGSGANDGRWVLNNGSTYSLTGGATYTWDLYKWKASNIPDSSTAVQTSDNPNPGDVLTYSSTLNTVVWEQPASGGVPATGGTFTGTVDFDGNVTQAVQAVSALNIDCSTGNYFTKTITGSSTFTFGSVPTSAAYSFVLELTHGVGNADVTWPGTVKWPNDTAPTFTSGKTSLFVFVTDDGGSRWRGASLVDYTT